MIHFFNPGNETAVLNGSKYYHASANQIKMQRDLAMLPRWYADKEDFVWISGKGEANKVVDIWGNERDLVELKNQKVELWGISPQGSYFFETLNTKLGMNWLTPTWKEEYFELSNRFLSSECLSYLTQRIPGIDPNILPSFYSDIADIEKKAEQSDRKQILKSPYSCSGRGLVWLPPGPLAQSERQIISGMLKKQSTVSIENAWEKVLDFSMHFEIKENQAIEFVGYSIFETNAKGAYEKSILKNQIELHKQVTRLVDSELVEKVKVEIGAFLKKRYAPLYQGLIGVDALIYCENNQFHLHPCIEINMRKSMGYLAIQLHQKHIDFHSEGEFYIDYCKEEGKVLENHLLLTEKYPPLSANNRFQSGYLNLCPVNETSHYHAYALISQKRQEQP